MANAAHGVVRGASTQERPSQTGRSLPFTFVVGVFSGFLLLALSWPPLLDVDLYWHLRAGQELLGGISPGQVGADWSFAPDPRPWTSTQSLSEVVLYLMHQAGGWSALIVFRTLSAALILVVLAYATLKGRSPALAGLPYSIAAVATISASQERPQQATLLGAAMLGMVVVQGLTEGRVPRWWIVVPGTAIWANLHGGWVLAPAALGLIALGRVVDHGLRDGVAGRLLGLMGLSLLAGSVSPVGPSGIVASLRMSTAAAAIREWARTEPLSEIGLLTAAMVLLVAFAWSLSHGVPRSEFVTTSCLVAFSWSAVRNVAPAMLMLAPLVAHRMCIAFPGMSSRREPGWSAPAGVVAACVLTLIGLISIPSREHLPSDKYPTQLAAQIADLPGAQRVLNDYNVAGLVLFFAGTDDQVAVDGRADRYGADAIDAHLKLIALTGDWEETLERLSPTSALIRDDSPLAHVLEEELSWRVAGRQDKWVLLQAE